MRTQRLLQALRPRQRWLGLGICALALVVAAVAMAEGLDPRRPWAFVVAEPSGPAPCDRGNRRRDGLVHGPLPEPARELWRRELPGGLDFMPVVGSDGAITAVLTNRIVLQLDPAGEERWRVPPTATDVAVPPALAADGSVALLGTEGQLWWVGPGRAIRQSQPLGTATRRAEAAPLVLDDGGVIVAAESELLHVGSDGAVRERTAVESLPIGGLLFWQGATVATLESGAVVAWRPPAPARVVGMLPSRPNGGGMLVGQRTLVAVAGTSSLVALDLSNGSTKLLAGGPGASRQLEGPPTLLPTGELAVATVVGELLVLDPRGQIVRELALDNAALLAQPDAAASLLGRIDLTPSPAMVADLAGRLAFVRAAGRLGVVTSPATSGQVDVSAVRFCGRALGIASAGSGRLLVACRNGSLGLFADVH